MQTLTPLPTVTLTAAEQSLAKEIDWFNTGHNHQRLRESCALAKRLAESLLERDGIAALRWRYFADDECNPGLKKSRYRVFKDNGCTDEDILDDGNFLRHLYRLIHGPELPTSTIAGFRRILEEDLGTTGMIQDQLCAFARAEVRSRRLDRHVAGDAFFMLTVECGEDLGLAHTVRRAAMSARY